MKNLSSFIAVIGLLVVASCQAPSSSLEQEGSKTAQAISRVDTLIITEKIVDTVFVERSAENDFRQSDYYIHERLPRWLWKMDFISDMTLKGKYKIENRMNPLYLEADFNGDGHLDLALPIRDIETGKKGFAIIHGGTEVISILGAGLKIKNALSEDLDYVDIWKINRLNINEPGLEENSGTGAKGELILQNPSLKIEKSELGGGLIYWDGQEYAYFHQTC